MNTADKPSDAARICTTNPAVVPVSDTSPAILPWHSVREMRYSRFGPGVTTRATQAAQNRSQVDNDSGMMSGCARKSPAGGRTSVDSVPESRKERTRAVLDSSAVGRGHFAPPCADPLLLRRLREVLVDPGTVFARDEAPADMEPRLQPRDARRTVARRIDHGRRVVDAKETVPSRQLGFG